MRTPPIWLAAATLIALASPIDAQGRIRGTLVDSLRGADPIADAMIELVGTDRLERTDRRGRFEFSNVPAGTHVVRYASPRLDSLGIRALLDSTVVDGRSRVEVSLAVPSAGWFQQRYCAADLGTSGILRGSVTDAAGSTRPGTPVAAIWDEAVLRVGQLLMETRATVDTTNAEGEYTLCGVPPTGQFVLRAGNADLGSGDLVLASAGAVSRHDLRVAERSLTTVVTGFVFARRGGSSIRVEVWGDSMRSTQVGADGSFRLSGVPRRTGQLYLRAVGQMPRVVTIEPTGPSFDIGEIQMENAAVALQPMTIQERQLTRERLSFLERSKGAVGVFFDSTFLAGLPRVTAGALASKNTLIRVGPVRTSTGISGETIMLRYNNALQGINGCYPRVYINGLSSSTQRPPRDPSGIQGTITPDYMKELLRTAKRIEVYTAAEAPAEFFDPDGCGSLVIWTR
ncbi:MAG: hypothetical protein KF709_00175 [Gemmatimonadaceae bacterium]|nr:hypothetical protein [Gemmatimonadaceae bacterium]